MPVINITDADIKYAETILLKKGQKFDEERVEFLKDLNTLDLQAVPGSGKTTVLLAKLLIFERYMPFKDASGVLVISHTNTAVDEIKNRIGDYCPKLFSFPNFIGTIQSFVNEFLAKPYVSQKFKVHINKVDTELFQNQLLKEFKRIAWSKEYDKPTTFFWGRHITKAQKESKRTNENKQVICNREIDKEVKKLYLDYSDSQIKLITDKKCLLKDTKNKKYQGIKKVVENTLKNGFLSFEYAYILANIFLTQNSMLRMLLQRRFKYIFVDEMQDMDEYQYQILETLFFDKGCSQSIYQRIGDKNQSIFNGDIKLDNIWKDRTNVKNITGSHRLSPLVANIANKFSLTQCDIEGLNKNCEIKPHIFVYTHENKHTVIHHYLSVIKQLQRKKQIPQNSLMPKVGVAWVSGKKDDANKITLASYCPDYNRERSKPKSEYNCLAQYFICFDKTNNSLNPIAKNIKNGIIKSLRLASLKDENDQFFKETTLKNLLHEKSVLDEKLTHFEKQIYLWSISVIRGKHKKVLTEIQDYITSLFKELFPGTEPDKSFLYDNYISNNDASIGSDAACSEIILNTVHGVKGQTHLSTLYMESFYDGEYESSFLKEVFGGLNSLELISIIESEINTLSEEVIKLNASGKKGAKTRQGKIKKLETKINSIKKYSKMLYVGFSRPTHLLAFAVEESRFKNLKVDKDTWNISNVKEIQHG
jgi:DNA helicase-2/ATP-dependent DNA helicase PcrA